MAKFTKKTGSTAGKKGGKNSKRKPLDVQWRDKLSKALSNSDKSTLDAIYGILLNEAKNGNMKAIEVLLDRAFGKSKQAIEMSGQVDSDQTTTINIVPVK